MPCCACAIHLSGMLCVTLKCILVTGSRPSCSTKRQSRPTLTAACSTLGDAVGARLVVEQDTRGSHGGGKRHEYADHCYYYCQV